MSLNSYATPEGGEIGRAQALQAQACYLAPHVDMNPILLKPEREDSAQVVVHGRVRGSAAAARYFDQTDELFRYVRESYARLREQYEAIVIEGAGSAAEVNLREHDMANWRTVELADAKVILVADIDRGGVFAQVVGTVDLLLPQERARLIGVVINKFRGDPKLFADGVDWLETRTGVPILGIVPFLRNLRLDQEDSLDLPRQDAGAFASDRINIAVALLPRMSNFTDFDALAAEEDVVLRYVHDPRQIEDADVVIIPGTKNTIEDLRYLRETGFVPVLERHADRGREIVGICGGYQMLGMDIRDPHGVEAGGREPGFALLDIETELGTTKNTIQVRASPVLWQGAESMPVTGYYIHLGRTARRSGRHAFDVFFGHGSQAALEAGRSSEVTQDGSINSEGTVWGTYIHGVFDEPQFRRAWLNRLRRRKTLPWLDVSVSTRVTQAREGAMDRWADHVERHMDLMPVLRAIQCGESISP